MIILLREKGKLSTILTLLCFQLEILYTQSMKMKNVTWKSNRVNVIDYIPGQRLTICYWRYVHCNILFVGPSCAPFYVF